MERPPHVAARRKRSSARPKPTRTAGGRREGAECSRAANPPSPTGTEHPQDSRSPCTRSENAPRQEGRDVGVQPARPASAPSRGGEDAQRTTAHPGMIASLLARPPPPAPLHSIPHPPIGSHVPILSTTTRFPPPPLPSPTPKTPPWGPEGLPESMGKHEENRPFRPPNADILEIHPP